MLDEKRRRSVVQLKIDLEDLAFAFENTAYDHPYFLDLETGEIVMVPMTLAANWKKSTKN